MDIVVWLRSLGLGKYEAAFRENEIDETVLPSLTHEILKELGSQQSVTGSSCSMLLLLCVTRRAANRPLLTQRPRRAPQAPLPKTAPSAAK
jgi:hypothetical protein